MSRLRRELQLAKKRGLRSQVRSLSRLVHGGDGSTATSVPASSQRSWLRDDTGPLHGASNSCSRNESTMSVQPAETMSTGTPRASSH